MRRLGISIYPEKSSMEEMLNYIEKASKCGFSRLFTCLLSVDKEASEIKEDFSKILGFAKSLGFENTVDIAPNVFEKLGISYKDLSFFKEIGADVVRLDVGFTGSEEALMTYNPLGMKVEINVSNDVSTIDTIFDFEPNKYNLYGCHNFYPHRYSGLSLDYFRKCTKRFKNHGVNVAAFVTSQVEGAYGPWPVLEGLPTLEMHRNMPLKCQVKHLIAMNEVDDILISNCYPSDEELACFADMRLDLLTLDVELEESNDEIENKIILEELHFNRGDVSEYFIRSTQPRVKYRGHEFKVHNTPFIKKGDILIESNEYGHYAGELQIALKDMPNSGRTNVVGHIVSDEIFLIDYIKPWQKFVFRKAK